MTKTVLGALAAALVLQSAAIAQTSPITLTPAGQKAPAASATVSERSGSLFITLTLPQGYQPARAAIFSGTCQSSSSASMNPDQPIALNVNATASAATTTLPDVTLNELTGKPHVIVVLGTPALCGDIKA